jgi:tetratricopeptide (TPR) repeat protein
MHLRAAEWYEKRDAFLFAEHLGRAEDDRAPAAYLDAANDLMAGLRFESAKNVVVKGLASAKSDADLFALNMSLGKAAIQTAEAELATQAYKSAIEHALTKEQECEANLGLALSYRDRPAVPVEETRRVLVASEQLAKSLESRRFQFECLYLKSYMYSLSAEIDECLRCAEAAVDLSAAEDEVALRLKALEALGMALYQNGRMRSHMPVIQEMAELSRTHDIRDWQLIAAFQLGGSCSYLCQFQKSIESCSLPIAEAERYGMIRAAVISNEFAARSQFAVGLLDEARLSAEKSLSLARSASMRARVALALIRLSEIARKAGESSASDFAEEALEYSDSLYVRPWALAVKARSETQNERAEKLLSEAESLLSSGPCTAHNHFHVRALQMEDGWDREDWNAIELAADKLEDFTKPEPLPWSDFHINRGRVLAAWGRGQKDTDYEQRLAQLRYVRRDAGWKIWLPEDA